MAMAPMGVTKPAAGVMATRPTTAPVAMPKTLGWPSRQANSIQESAAAAAAVLVFTKA
jgi:hypothetical protein